MNKAGTSQEFIEKRLAELKASQPTSLRHEDGDILQNYELGDEIANTENGGQGTVMHAKRKDNGSDVVIKIYSAKEKGTWDEIFHEEKRAGREIGFLERANKDGINGLPVLVEYGVTGSFIKTPVAVFKPLPGKTLEEEVINPTYAPTIERTWSVVSSLREALEYAHKNKSTKPVVHRDINPGNIMVNGNPTPAVLMDWAGSSNPSSGKTLIRTQMLTRNFSAPEVTNGDESDERADIYGLGKVAQYMLLGQETFKLQDGIPTRKDFQGMNIPSEAISVLEKATAEKPENRYRNVSDFYDAFSKSLGRNLPVPVKIEAKPTQKVNENINSGLPEVTDNGDGSLSIGGFKFELDRGKGVYQTAKEIHDYIGERFAPDHQDFFGENNIFALAYLQHAAQEHPILQEVLDGKTTLEDAVRERKPSVFSEHHYEAEEWKEAKKSYNEKRSDLYKVFGAEKRDNFFGAIIGEMALGLATPMAYINNLGLEVKNLRDKEVSLALACLIGGALVGAYSGFKLSEGYGNRKLLKQAREMDSWIREARISQGLESKVESVELTEDETNNVSYTSFFPSAFLGTAISSFVIPYLISPYINNSLETEVGSAFVLAWGFGVLTFLGVKKVFDKHLTSRALKKKRIAAGLDEDGMKKYDSFQVLDRNHILKNILTDDGFKKKFLRRKFVSEGVEVSYEDTGELGVVGSTHGPFGTGIGYTGRTNVTISAEPGYENRAKQIAENLRERYGLESKTEPAQLTESKEILYTEKWLDKGDNYINRLIELNKFFGKGDKDYKFKKKYFKRKW